MTIYFSLTKFYYPYSYYFRPTLKKNKIWIRLNPFNSNNSIINIKTLIMVKWFHFYNCNKQKAPLGSLDSKHGSMAKQSHI